MSFEQWLRNGWLQLDETTVAEIQRLRQVADRDLADAEAAGLSADGRFQHAYDAALQLCLLALRAAGYRVRKGPGHHKYGIDSLRHTLGERWADTADHIERCSRLRAQAVYERIGVVSDEDAQDLIDTARQHDKTSETERRRSPCPSDHVDRADESFRHARPAIYDVEHRVQQDARHVTVRNVVSCVRPRVRTKGEIPGHERALIIAGPGGIDGWRLVLTALGAGRRVRQRDNQRAA